MTPTPLVTEVPQDVWMRLAEERAASDRELLAGLQARAQARRAAEAQPTRPRSKVNLAIRPKKKRR